jgi:hypothetical protein
MVGWRVVDDVGIVGFVEQRRVDRQRLLCGRFLTLVAFLVDQLSC